MWLLSKMNSINTMVLLPMEEWKWLVKDNKRDVKTISILGQKGDGHISPSPLETEKSLSPSPPPPSPPHSPSPMLWDEGGGPPYDGGEGAE